VAACSVPGTGGASVPPEILSDLGCDYQTARRHVREDDCYINHETERLVRSFELSARVTLVRLIDAAVKVPGCNQGRIVLPFLLLLLLVGWDLRHQVLRPLLAYCTAPDDR
jgi:hypothetical protein